MKMQVFLCKSWNYMYYVRDICSEKDMRMKKENSVNYDGCILLRIRNL